MLSLPGAVCRGVAGERVFRVASQFRFWCGLCLRSTCDQKSTICVDYIYQYY